MQLLWYMLMDIIAPVLLKKGVSLISNNYTGELVGIQIGAEFLSELDNIQNRSIHILTRHCFWHQEQPG